ncbi:hypothetical protein RI543_001771 [Arxiozyma heterogenica]|uniref:Uncharacterized protein n=1 Tax=Arxiozyma heterogenica TaxID=278026 RepID=A0AAN7W3X3_9SACH|nr:hypothetical protein RI543_001771 [Kazachstania heterogenica]
MFVRIHSQSWAQSFGCSKSFASTLGVTCRLRNSGFPVRVPYRTQLHKKTNVSSNKNIQQL